MLLRYWTTSSHPNSIDLCHGAKGFTPEASQAVLGVEKRQRLQRQLLQPAEARCRSAEAVVEVPTCDAGGSIGGSMEDPSWPGNSIKQPKSDGKMSDCSNLDVGTIFRQAIELSELMVMKMSQLEDGSR